MSAIEWTDETWNPVIGCTPVSPGCLNCYAATMAHRLQHMKQATDYAPRVVDNIPARPPIRIAEVKNGRAVFSGEVRCLPHKLDEPLHWRTPRRVFVNSMSDLFHEAVPFEFIDRAFAVMALCPRHTFQLLTKRPERMAEYLDGYSLTRKAAIRKAGDDFTDFAPGPTIPLPNVWLGASVERQNEADERIPHLLRCPAKFRFLSCEPLLGPVELSEWIFCDECRVGQWGRGAIDDPLSNAAGGRPWRECRCAKIDWVIVGGESGPHARPCDVAWIRSIVKQCQDAGVPCFVKQLGARVFVRNDKFSEWPRDGDGLEYDPSGPGFHYQGEHVEVHTVDPKGGDPSEWPADLRVRQFPEVGE